MTQLDKNAMKLMKIRKMGYKGLMENFELFVVDLMNKNEKLEEKLANYDRDAEIQKLKQELNSLRKNSLYIMSELEIKEVDSFRKEHYLLCKGNTQFLVEGNGIGSTLNLQCSKCKATKDVTDYRKW